MAPEDSVEAINRYGRPEIFNTDQDCQFISLELTDMLKNDDIKISMDGNGCCRDNVFIERLWCSVKYEEVYLYDYDCVNDANRVWKNISSSIAMRGRIHRLTTKRQMRSTSTACLYCPKQRRH